MAVEIVPATYDLAAEVVSRARDADRLEFSFAEHPPKPMGAIVTGMLKVSHRAKVGLIDGVPICVAGVIARTALSTEAHPWMVAAAEVEKPEFRRRFLEHSRDALDDLTKGYSHLWGVVHKQNKMAIRWLRWMGFQISKETFLVNEGVFHRFDMRR